MQCKFWKRTGWASMGQLRIHLWHYLPLLPPKSSPGSENLPQSFHSTSFLPLIPSGTPGIIAGRKRCLRVRGLCRFRGLRVWSRDQTLTRAFVQLKGPRPVSIPDELWKWPWTLQRFFLLRRSFRAGAWERGGVVLIPCRRSLVKTRVCSKLPGPCHVSWELTLWHQFF